jgi:4-hydroxybenzoate polyprenyltransferase
VSSASKSVNFLAQIGRLSLLGTTFIFVFIGVASCDGEASAGRLLLVLVTAFFFHLAVYAWNDIADLRIDRSQPRRARSPLVRGDVGVRTVVAFAGGATLVALALAAVLGGKPLLWMALSLAGLLLYDALGKRIGPPIGVDFIQGLGWAALVVFGGVATGRTSGVLMVNACYVVITILLVNGVHGALRDLPNDFRCGARTTAIELGARPLPNGGAEVPVRLRAYAIVLQLAMSACLIGAAADTKGPATTALIFAGSLTALVLLWQGLQAAASPERSWIVALVHILLVLTLPVVLVADRLDTTELLILLVLFGAPWASVARPLRHRLRPVETLK